MILSRQLSSSSRWIYALTAFVSLSFSLYLSRQTVMINPDAVCYLLSAQTFGESNISNAMHLCGQAEWPFYSVMIYAVAKLASISLLNSAFILNALLSLMTVLAFIAIVEKLGGSKRVLWLAAFVILTAHQFNSVREYIVRDHGFWAFFLISFLFYLRFMRDHSWFNAIAASCCLLLAALFRVEGVVYFLALPWLALFSADHWRGRFVNVCKLNLLSLLGVAALLLWVGVHPDAMQHFGRLQEIPNQLTNGVLRIVEMFQTEKQQLVTYLLPVEAARDAGAVWACVLVVMFFWNVIGNVGLINTAMFLYALTAGIGKSFTASDRLVWLGFTLLNVVVCALFFAERLFFAKRYLIALTLLFLLWVPFVLHHLLMSAERRKHYVAYAVMAAMLLSSTIYFYRAQAGRAYVPEAGVWIAANIHQEVPLYVNDFQLAYYSQHFGNAIFTEMRHLPQGEQVPWQHYQYAALRLRSRQPDASAAALVARHATVIKTFANDHGDQVVIYKVGNQS